MTKEKQLRTKAEKHILNGEYKEAKITYLEILKIIRPNTIKANGYLSAIEDCKIWDSLSDGSMELRDNIDHIVDVNKKV